MLVSRQRRASGYNIFASDSIAACLSFASIATLDFSITDSTVAAMAYISGIAMVSAAAQMLRKIQ